MEIQPDFKELLELLNAHDVDYVIAGGYALAFHGAPRYTGDIDICVRPTGENASRIIAALTEFGFGSVGLTVSDLDRPDQIIQLGVPPVRVDIITSLSAVTWEEIDNGRCEGVYGDVSTWYVGRDAFVRSKRAGVRIWQTWKHLAKNEPKPDKAILSNPDS